MNTKNDIDRFIDLTKRSDIREDYSDLVLQKFHSEKQTRIRNNSLRTNLISGMTSLAAVLILMLTVRGVDSPRSIDYSYSGQTGIFNEYLDDYAANSLTGTDPDIDEMFKEEIGNHVLPGDNSDALLQVMREYQIEAAEVVNELSEDEAEFLLNNL
ncbi:MAG: hypothetical protein HUU54_02365 [Ignavibacteriaceae bacterium]|nr:hypothetical protein [Ignavibacteriaceae bacterium]